MRKSKENNYLNKIWSDMYDHLKIFLHTQDQTALHQFRVQVKRLKSLLKLFSTSSANKKILKKFTPVKEIFHHAGIIRDAHLRINLANQYDAQDENFNNEQQEKMALEVQKFCSNGKVYQKSIKQSRNIIKKELHKIGGKSIASFYKKELDKIVLALAKMEFNEEMHDCRKRIKNLIYNKDIAEKSIPDLRIDVDYLDQIQNAIGEWHDAVLALKIFTNDSENEASLNKLKKQVSELENKIISLSQNFWYKVTLKGIQD